jgi:hypothetical protein
VHDRDDKSHVANQKVNPQPLTVNPLNSNCLEFKSKGRLQQVGCSTHFC